jgi:anthranilate/para-aminobenzoate synthase component I
VVIQPSWQEIEYSLRGEGGIVISLEVTPPLDPLSVFQRLREREIKAFWLDSARFHPQTGRYSFIGLNPVATFHEVSQLREILNQKKVTISPGLPPFTSGLIGYFSYGGECEWVQVQTVISWDHQQNRCWITEPFYPAEQGEKEYHKIVARIKQYERSLQVHSVQRSALGLAERQAFSVQKTENLPPHPALSPLWGERGRVRGLEIQNIHFEMNQRSFEQMVLRAKEYIAAGDIYQVNLSQRISADINGDPFELYLRLRQINPSPFACYLPMNHMTIAGSSPERLLKVAGNRVETRPIAGTRPRIVQNTFVDRRYAQELLLSAKERAEHIMLVDLERNDLGRVCEYGSVEVNELMAVEEYSHVRHIVSNIRGKKCEECDRLDAVEAVFPGGTITGTPKIRSMEVIKELEPVDRGLYTGSVGYLSFSGEMDLNIVIRTFLIMEGRLHIQVGAGIVADSIPEKEYEETLRKGEALLEAVRSMKNATSEYVSCHDTRRNQ